MTDRFTDPVVLIGTHRSGTSWLGNALGNSKELAYWVEPRHVWSYGNWFRDDDVLHSRDATEGIRRYIRKRFWQFTQRQGAVRFCEKTPANCLRIPFVRSVLPEAKIIFIYRDGRAVFRSTAEIQKGGIGWIRVRDRLRETTIWDVPAFVDRVPWMWRKLTGRPLRYWGVRPPGWKDWLRDCSPNEILAKQWAASIQAAMAALEEVPDSRKLVLQYETLVSNPDAVDQLLDFISLDDSTPVREFIKRTAHASSVAKWRDELSAKLLDEIRPHVEPALTQLQYEW